MDFCIGPSGPGVASAFRGASSAEQFVSGICNSVKYPQARTPASGLVGVEWRKGSPLSVKSALESESLSTKPGKWFSQHQEGRVRYGRHRQTVLCSNQFRCNGYSKRFQILTNSQKELIVARSLPGSLNNEVVDGKTTVQEDNGTITDGQQRNLHDFNGFPTVQFRDKALLEVQPSKSDPNVSREPHANNTGHSKRKKRELGVRKPSSESGNSDFAIRFGLSSALLASNSDSFSLEEARQIEFYDPKSGDEVLGVVVAGNEYKVEVDVGSQQLGLLLTKDACPLDGFRVDELQWKFSVVEESNLQEPILDPPLGQVRVACDEEADKPLAARAPVIELGSVLRLKVVGVTLSGEPILSLRKVALPVAWERVRQIKSENEPIEVRIHQWTSGGLLTKIEGLRAFLPLNHLLNRALDSSALKTRVGERVQVLITEVDEENGKVILSEKRAWGLKNLRPGTLHDGVVNKIFSFGVEVNLRGTSFRGMIHISNVSRSRVRSLEEVFCEGESIKVMVIKSPLPHRIALSTADLESSKGLILGDKERVFAEAEEMAARYRSSLLDSDSIEVDSTKEDNHDWLELPTNEIANWEWLNFEDLETLEL